MLNEIISAKKNNRIHLFKNILAETPEWSNFIDHLDYQYKNTNVFYTPNDKDREHFINGVLFKNPFYLNITYPTIEFYPQIDLFFKKFNFLPNNGKPLSAYVNFAAEPPSSMHSDRYDHFYWQCIGKTRWVSEEFDEIVSSGDVLYVPGKLEHQVFTFEPRAALQFEYKLPTGLLQNIMIE